MKTLIVALALTIGASTSAFAMGEAADKSIPASLQNLEQGHTVSLSGNNSAYGFKSIIVTSDQSQSGKPGYTNR